ncbi:MAG: hypothetical protein IKK28_15125 [Mogibacterium sp.]|nr:hypothetical protein [Mogibacterium sp.]
MKKAISMLLAVMMILGMAHAAQKSRKQRQRRASARLWILPPNAVSPLLAAMTTLRRLKLNLINLTSIIRMRN